MAKDTIRATYEAGKPVYVIYAKKFGNFGNVEQVEFQATTLDGVRKKYQAEDYHMARGQVWRTYHRSTGKKDKLIGLVNTNMYRDAYYQSWSPEHVGDAHKINSDGSLGRLVVM